MSTLTFAERLYSRLCAAEGCGRGIGHLGPDVAFCDGHRAFAQVTTAHPDACQVPGCRRQASGGQYCGPCASEAARRKARAGARPAAVSSASAPKAPPPRLVNPPPSAPRKPAPAPADPGRRCSRCHTLYPPHLVETAFRLDASSRKGRYRKTVCRPCEQTARDATKVDDRWTVKARDVVRRHVDSLQKHHPGLTKADLIERYGWAQARLAHDAEHQYGNGCNYCGHQYKAMSHGLADITLDVIDPKAAPYYRTNTKWCCMTCNRKKGGMSPEQFEQDRQVFELWSVQCGREFDPLVDDPGSLFHDGA